MEKKFFKQLNHCNPQYLSTVSVILTKQSTLEILTEQGTFKEW